MLSRNCMSAVVRISLSQKPCIKKVIYVKVQDLWHVKETRDECEAVTEKID